MALKSCRKWDKLIFHSSAISGYQEEKDHSIAPSIYAHYCHPTSLPIYLAYRVALPAPKTATFLKHIGHLRVPTPASPASWRSQSVKEKLSQTSQCLLLPKPLTAHTCSQKAHSGSNPSQTIPFQGNCDVAMETTSEVFPWLSPRLRTHSPHCKVFTAWYARSPLTSLSNPGLLPCLSGTVRDRVYVCVYIHICVFVCERQV